jgi:hypothetical protein
MHDLSPIAPQGMPGRRSVAARQPWREARGAAEAGRRRSQPAPRRRLGSACCAFLQAIGLAHGSTHQPQEIQENGRSTNAKTAARAAASTEGRSTAAKTAARATASTESRSSNARTAARASARVCFRALANWFSWSSLHLTKYLGCFARFLLYRVFGRLATRGGFKNAIKKKSKLFIFLFHGLRRHPNLVASHAHPRRPC